MILAISMYIYYIGFNQKVILNLSQLSFKIFSTRLDFDTKNLGITNILLCGHEKQLGPNEIRRAEICLRCPPNFFFQLAAEKKTSLSVAMSYIFRPSLLILSELYQHTELFLKKS